jgi:hypothetical protein
MMGVSLVIIAKVERALAALAAHAGAQPYELRGIRTRGRRR